MFSNVEIFPVKNNKGPIKGRGRVTVADAVNINVTVVQGKDGMFVGLPSHKGKDKDGNDKWWNDVYIKDEKAREELTKKVLDAFQALQSDQGEAAGPTDQTTDSIPF